jgi:hypothetical protein
MLVSRLIQGARPRDPRVIRNESSVNSGRLSNKWLRIGTLSKLTFTVVLVIVCSVSAGPPKSVVKGVVTDSTGGVIPRARVILHWDQSGARVGLVTNVGVSEDIVVETNKDGEVSTELPPGFYDLFVSAMAFSPDCRKVRIQPGESATYSFKLKADPLVAKELGFTIPDISK